MPIAIKKLGQKGGPKGQDKVMPLPKKKPRHANPKHPMNAEKTKPLGKANGGPLSALDFKRKNRSLKMPPPPPVRSREKGVSEVPKEFMGTRPMESKAADKKRSRRGSAKSAPSTGMAAGGKLKMVEKGGKKVPFFAADGKGKMAMGGMMKKKGYAKGGPVKVKSGDTLSQIAKKNGLTLKSLMAANPGIKNANEIRVGQSIKMPTGRAAMRSGIAFQDVDKNLNKRNNVYAGMTKSSMKALADDTAAKKAKKAGKPVSKKQSETANKRARVTTRLNQLGAINKERRAADADKRPSAAKKTKSQVEVSKGTRAMSKAASLKNVTSQKNRKLDDYREKMRRKVDRKAGGGMMKKKGYAKGGMMKKGMAKGGVMRGTGAATKGKRFGRSG